MSLAAARAAALALAAALLGGCASGALSPGARKEGIVVDARGAAPDPKAALAAARRDAVAGLLDLFISSGSRAASGEVIDGRILGRAGDYLGKVKILSENRREGLSSARIRALVRTPLLGRDLEKLGLLRPEGVSGAPRIVVAIDEPAADSEPGRASDALRRKLLERGYLALDLSDRLATGARRPKDGAEALSAARRLQGQVLLAGKASVEESTDGRLSGTPAFAAKLVLQALLAGTGEVLGPVEAQATAVDVTATGASGRALENAGEAAADILRTLLAGRLRELSEITVTVGGLGGVPETRRFLEALRSYPQIAGAALDVAVGKDVRVRVFAEKLSADDLAAGLLRLKGFRFSVRAVEPYYQSIELEAGGADMHARGFSMGLRGAECYPVLVELDLANGLPAFTTVGLPDVAVREARERVTSALRNSGFAVPARRVTVNLAPAQSRKEGPHFDLPIALALLCASDQLPARAQGPGVCCAGELALDGSLRPVPGVLVMAAEAKARGFEGIVVPAGNLAEAQAAGLKAFGAASLREAAEFLGSEDRRWSEPAAARVPSAARRVEDLSDVRGQALAKRALELAASGGHNLLLVGSPGTGKSMLARRLAGLLPPLSAEEALVLARLRAASGRGGEQGVPTERPFRSPHHSSSQVSLVGGGPRGRPGEVSLAHGGVLFLDELAEFGRASLEALRQPLEARTVSIARARETVEYPARFLLAAAVNPCPCGWRGHPRRACGCPPGAVGRYLGRLSGPLLDRIDLQVETAPLPFEDWAGGEPAAGERTAAVRARVARARAVSARRWGPDCLNADAPAAALRASCALDGEGLALLGRAASRLGLTARALDRVLRVARTAADLAGSETVARGHLSEALQYRSLDRLHGRT